MCEILGSNDCLTSSITSEIMELVVALGGVAAMAIGIAFYREDILQHCHLFNMV